MNNETIKIITNRLIITPIENVTETKVIDDSKIEYINLRNTQRSSTRQIWGEMVRQRSSTFTNLRLTSLQEQQIQSIRNAWSLKKKFQ